jgi:hypothetical protein
MFAAAPPCDSAVMIALLLLLLLHVVGAVQVPAGEGCV